MLIRTIKVICILLKGLRSLTPPASLFPSRDRDVTSVGKPDCSLLLSHINIREKQNEWGFIQLKARNHNFPQNLIQKLNRQIQHKTTHVQTEERDEKKNLGQHSPTKAHK